MGEGELEIKDSSMRHKWSVKSLCMRRFWHLGLPGYNLWSKKQTFETRLHVKDTT